MRTVFIRRCCFRSIAGLLPVRRRTGSRPLRRGFFVGLRIKGSGGVRFASGQKDRLSATASYARATHAPTYAFGLVTEPSAPLPGFRVSRENTESRSLRKAARKTPSLAACIARRSVPSMRVTSGPGVPTGGSLPGAQRPRAPSSADERFDLLLTNVVERDFKSQYPKPAGPKSREDLATPRFRRVRAKTQKRQGFQRRR